MANYKITQTGEQLQTDLNKIENITITSSGVTDGTNTYDASNKVTYVKAVYSAIDLNSLSGLGFWTFSDTALINGPYSSSTRVYGFIIQFNPTYRNQLFVGGAAGENFIYHRRYLSGSASFTPWQKVANISDLTSKQDKLTAGNNITIDIDNVISAAGGTQLYMHHLTTTGVPEEGHIDFYIITKDATAITDFSIFTYSYFYIILPTSFYVNSDIENIYINNCRFQDGSLRGLGYKDTGGSSITQIIVNSPSLILSSDTVTTL